ncbi:nicotinamidase-related amidase [Melghirimyces profundicolus]|uniref:Nicotinamidase-related amidase n=1 Tax=Melghirimyces profundicolus TaxID=1242148 RepID=A0A2T6C9C6_9BACL|nr:isochorismatase family protein [Melghirimyces profundicolus]PTX64915.1 nicotinamidase-related amidase [Melghirimyces profundicolus]
MDRRDAFLNDVEEDLAGLPSISASALVEEAGGTDRLYLVFVDILKGFCEEGPLASERVAEMVDPVRRLAGTLVEKGLPGRNLVFLQDEHAREAAEFSAFPPHCIRGTSEAETVKALQPFLRMEGARLFRKNATNALFGRDGSGRRFFEFLEEGFRQGPATFVVTGDCTDLCIYQNAMGIRLLANEHNADVRVVVSKEHVRTYDTPVETAREAGIPAHDGELMDALFLYHMKLNGIEVVQTITAG